MEKCVATSHRTEHDGGGKTPIHHLPLHSFFLSLIIGDYKHLSHRGGVYCYVVLILLCLVHS